MKKSKIYIVELAIIFVILTLLFSIQWIRVKWDRIDFSVIMFQLNVPLKGTPHELITDYLGYVFPKVVAILLLFLSIWKVGSKSFFLDWQLKLFNWSTNITTNSSFYRSGVKLVLAIAIIIFSVNLYVKIDDLGVLEYFEQQRYTSRYYEDYYVNPNDVVFNFPEAKNNLILIFLESMECTYASVEHGGGKPYELIPNLVSLANDSDNISFSDTDGFGGMKNGPHTGFTLGAILSATSGIDYRLPGYENGGYYSEFLPGVVSLGDILQQNGYTNYFLCGSDGEFASRKEYFEQHGYQPIIDYNAMKTSGFVPADYDNGFWGIEDKKLYEISKSVVTQAYANSEPFCLTMLTVDTHHPDGYLCDECGFDYSSKYANVVAHADKMIGDYLKWCRLQPWYNNTTIVILGDHTSMNATFWDDIGDYDRKIYNCIINARPISDTHSYHQRKFTPYDMFPTILSSIGVQWDDNKLGLGVDLFSGEATHAEIDEFEEFEGQSQYYMDKFILLKEE